MNMIEPNHLYSALIISGGDPVVVNSVEVFVPSTGQHCQLPAIPGDLRFTHTMEGRTVCGGDSDSVDSANRTKTSCLTLNDAGWEVSTTLIEPR